MKHYIIVEVRERDPNDDRLITDVGMVRKALHDFVKVKGINAADAVIREDREFLHPLMQVSGEPRERNPYFQAKELFFKAMGPRWRKFKQEAPEEISWDRKWQV